MPVSRSIARMLIPSVRQPITLNLLVPRKEAHCDPVSKNIDYDTFYSEPICEERVAWAKTEREWAERAARHLKAELKRADMTYDDLAAKLKRHGFDETKASIANKLARATLSAHFFLASLAAMGREQIALADI
jgi:hypothetical protein